VKAGASQWNTNFGSAGSAIAAAITAAAAAAAAATVATATATTAATVTTTTAALRASFARTRFVHGQSATFHGFAIKLGNGILCFLFRRHGHKSEATRLACEFILHKHDILHSTSLCEEILKVGFRRIERKISNV
jgi:phosphoglucomutase